MVVSLSPCVKVWGSCVVSLQFPASRDNGPMNNKNKHKYGVSKMGYNLPAGGQNQVGYNSYSRDSYAIPKKRRKWPFVVLAVVLVLLLAAGGVAFAGVVYMNSLNDKLQNNIDDELKATLSSEAVQPGDPFYCLIMGTDSSEERRESGAYGDTFRSDSMILARIDPRQKTVALVSIERDTYVNIEGYGPNKLNASAAFGGAPLVVSTVSTFAGVPISHYASIDFDGFKDVVDALGGIEVDVPMEIDDADAGGHVDAGLQTLNGEQALILCRARNAYEEAGYSGGDFYRAANQRMVIGAIAKKLMESDPATMATSIATLCDYVTTDMSVTDIVSVANSMRGIDTENNIWSAMNPTISAYENGVYIEYSDNEAWRKMMTRVDDGLPPYEDEKRNVNDGGTLDGTVRDNS